jgi:glycosyltransferase involved in cell wall biosynthesis
LLLPNKDNEAVLGLVLERLAAHTTHPDVELVVVDDGSTDGSREILRSWRDGGAFRGDVELIEQPNRGAVDALNTALGASTGEICVQIDSDASVETEGWIERLLELMLADERVGVVTGKVVMDSGALHTCGVNLISPEGWHDRPSRPLEPVGHRRWHHRVARYDEGEGGPAETRAAEVDAGMGCCMMYRRADAIAAGGYDANWSPVWFDDVDLSLSIRRLGKKVFCLPSVRVVHHIGVREFPARSRLHMRAGRRLPPVLRGAIEGTLRIDFDGYFSRAQIERLEHHYRYWREKWGWDARNPDMAEIERRWGDTEIWWAHDPDRRAAGEAIVSDVEERRRAVGG